MNADRFDAVAKLIARRRLSRRQALAQAGAGLAAGALAVAGLSSAAAQDGTPVAAGPASTTGGMAEAINAFRAQNGLPAIPVSPALTKVAQAHVRDLAANHPDHVPGCNLHSWSDNGQWTDAAIPGAKGGCFTGKFTDAENHIMWDKPKEIAGYPGNGYENAYWNSAGATAEDAVQAWVQPGDPHRDLILNVGIWTDPWNALGGWVEGEYAVAWFGNEIDPTPPTIALATPAPAATPVADCSAGQTDCGSGCVDMTSDTANCGACGFACSTGQTCANGVCQ
jgi:hypothetical protein